MPITTATQLLQDIRETLDVSEQSSGRYTDDLIKRRIDLAQDRLYAFVSRLGLSDYLTHFVAVEVDPTLVPGVVSIALPPTGRINPASTSTPKYPIEYIYWLQGLTSPGLPAPGNASEGYLAPDPYKIRSVRIVETYEPLTVAQLPPEHALKAIFSWGGRTALLELQHREEMWQDLDRQDDWSVDYPPRYRLAQGQILFDRRSTKAAGFVIEYHCRPLAVDDTIFGFALMPLWQQYIAADVCAELLERDREFQLADRQRAKLDQISQQLEDSARRHDASPKRMRDDQTLDSWGGLGDQELRDRVTLDLWRW